MFSNALFNNVFKAPPRINLSILLFLNASLPIKSISLNVRVAVKPEFLKAYSSMTVILVNSIVVSFGVPKNDFSSIYVVFEDNDTSPSCKQLSKVPKFIRFIFIGRTIDFNLVCANAKLSISVTLLLISIELNELLRNAPVLIIVIKPGTPKPVNVLFLLNLYEDNM